MPHSRYTIWDDDQECWVLYKNGKFIGGDAINAFGELEDTGATPFDIRKMQKIARTAEAHGGIYHLAALDDAAMEGRLIILPEGVTVESIKPIFQLYAPNIYWELWGKFETPQERTQRKIIEEVEADNDELVGESHDKGSPDELAVQQPGGEDDLPDDYWRDPYKSFDGWK